MSNSRGKVYEKHAPLGKQVEESDTHSGIGDHLPKGPTADADAASGKDISNYPKAN